jgi:hypothetical protein
MYYMIAFVKILAILAIYGGLVWALECRGASRGGTPLESLRQNELNRGGSKARRYSGRVA